MSHTARSPLGWYWKRRPDDKPRARRSKPVEDAVSQPAQGEVVFYPHHLAVDRSLHAPPAARASKPTPSR